MSVRLIRAHIGPFCCSLTIDELIVVIVIPFGTNLSKPNRRFGIDRSRRHRT
jgi:hypothetical protein